MSFQFAPQTLLNEVNRQIQKLQTELSQLEQTRESRAAQIRKESAFLADRPKRLDFALLLNAARRKATAIQAGEGPGELKIQNEIDSLNDQVRLLLDEINIRSEIIQPSNVNLDTGEIFSGLEQPIKQIDLKKLALIGGGLLLLS